MIAAAGGESQVREVGDEIRIHPKSRKHWLAMQEANQASQRLEVEAGGHIGAGWQTERVRMRNGELREMPVGTGLPVIPRWRGRRVPKETEAQAAARRVRPLKSVDQLIDERYPS